VIGVRSVALTHARGLWRRRWFGVAVAWVVCLAGWAFVIHMPNQYEAKARIYVDTDSMLRPLMRGIAIDTNILTQVDVMQRTLLSRPNLQKVSHMADLDLGARTPAEAEEVVNGLRQRIVVSPDGRNLFSLAYTGPSRETATKVVQSLLTVFVESNLGNSRKDMASARSFIDDQLKDYAQQLDLAEKRVADFKAKNIGFLPGDNNYITKLDAARQDLDKAKSELEENRQRRDELTKQLASVPRYVDTVSIGPADDGGAGPPLGMPGDAGGGSDTSNARVVELEQKLKSLLDNYTELHPDVVKTKRLLEQAKQEAKQAQEQKATADTPAAPSRATRSTASNPVYEQLQLQLVTLEASIASLDLRYRRAQSEVEKWEKLAKSVPEVGAEMAKLTRDYDVTKKAYDELLNRRESAKIGSDLETQTQTIQFRIVDPPDSPTLPVAPKRGLLISVVLVAGIAAGGAFAFLLAQIDDSIMTVRQLKDLVTVPVLGAISAVAKTSQSRRRAFAMAGFVAICLGLVVVYVGIVSVETFIRPRA